MVLFFLLIQLSQISPIYFSDPYICEQGIIVTDNYCSALYIINDQTIKEILAGPGCGRYFNLSPDKKYIGYKSIQENGLQTPALYDIPNKKIISLHAAAYQVGQPSFSNNGSIVFSVGDTIIIKNADSIASYVVNNYSNLTPISPSGQYIAYNDDNDQIYILNAQNSERICITDNKTGYFAPIWSPNSRYILYSSLDGKIFSYEMVSKQTYCIGPGNNPSWSLASWSIIFYRTEYDKYMLKGAEIYLSSYDGLNITRLTNTPDIHEMDAKFINQNRIIYHTYDRGEIIITQLSDNQLKQIESVISTGSPPPIHHYNIVTDFGIRDSIDVPYINQVYDTPDWHNGHWSCAPTTAMMAIAYYRKLPYWDCWSSSPYGHTSHFGNYICAQYNYQEFTYSDTARDPSNNISWGGYGYMWYNGYSPYSRMVNYINYHDITSWTDNTPTWDETLAEIQAGYPYCMCVELTASGHLVLAVGQVSNWHTIIFNDPYGDKNTPGYPSYDGKYARYDWPGYNNGYQNLNQVYWCRGARGSWPPPCDTIIDDLQFRYPGEPYGFFMYNQSPSNMRYFRDNIIGYSDHMWWTYSCASTDTCYVTWTPVIPQNDTYEVFAYIPGVNANASARYEIHHSGGTAIINIDQSNFSDEWVSIGSYYFTTNGGYVYLGDATGTPGQRIAFDAMKWSANSIGTAEKPDHSQPRLCRLLSNIVKNSLMINITDHAHGQITVSIYDITGKCIYQNDHRIQDNGNVVIDVSNLTNSIYFMIVANQDFKYSEKFIVIRNN